MEPPFEGLLDCSPASVYVSCVRLDHPVNKVCLPCRWRRRRRVPFTEAKGCVEGRTGQAGQLVQVTVQRCINLAYEHQAGGDKSAVRTGVVVEKHESSKVNPAELLERKRLGSGFSAAHRIEHIAELAEGAAAHRSSYAEKDHLHSTGALAH